MTLQEHYNAIKNGKGNKDQFLKQARQLFPQYLNQYSDFNTATNVLKSKQIISEAAGGVVTKGFDIFNWKKILTEIKTEDLNLNTLYQYDGLFTLGANEGKKVKGTCKYIESVGTDNNRFRFKWVKVDSTNADYTVRDDSSFFTNKDGLKYITPIGINESVKAVEKEISKEAKDANKYAYNNTDMKNADNINFNEIMKGFYAELKDSKNYDKTGDEIKAMVVKNLAKDPLFYTKDGEFGVKGIGYTDEAPGLGKNTQPTSKNASVLGGNDETNSDSDIVKNSLSGSTKKNVKDTLSDSEAKDSMPKKVKEMPDKGVSGVEKKIKLKEGIHDRDITSASHTNIRQLPGGFWDNIKYEDASKLFDYHERTGNLPVGLSSEKYDEIMKKFNISRMDDSDIPFKNMTENELEEVVRIKFNNTTPTGKKGKRFIPEIPELSKTTVAKINAQGKNALGWNKSHIISTKSIIDGVQTPVLAISKALLDYILTSTRGRTSDTPAAKRLGITREIMPLLREPFGGSLFIDAVKELFKAGRLNDKVGDYHLIDLPYTETETSYKFKSPELEETEMYTEAEQKLRSIISQIIKEELNK
jgi:hypothetical protein